jgi:hypothetical protein
MRYRNAYFSIVTVFLFLPITLSSQSIFKAPTDSCNCWKKQCMFKQNDTDFKFQSNFSESDNGVGVVNEQSKTKTESKSTNTKSCPIVIICICCFLVGLFIGSRYSRRKIYSLLYEEKNACIEGLKDQLIQLKAKNEELFNENISLKAKNEELLNENISLGGEIENFKSQSISNNLNPKQDNQEVLNQKFIYFDIPKTDGSFKNSKTHQRNDTFYKIELDDSKQTGKLYFISGDYDLRALDNIDYYLNPVCEIQNIEDRIGAKRIKMVKTGTVILLNGDSWKIKEKVKIKLI